jgi:hypothetical protein
MFFSPIIKGRTSCNFNISAPIKKWMENFNRNIQFIFKIDSKIYKYVQTKSPIGEDNEPVNFIVQVSEKEWATCYNESNDCCHVFTCRVVDI